MLPLKRRKVTAAANQSTGGDNKQCIHHDCAVFILERKMGSSRRSFLTTLGRSKGFLIEESFSAAVTHVVSENNTGDDVHQWLEKQMEGRASDGSVHLLDIAWLTESLAGGRPVPVLDRHRLKVSPKPCAKPSTAVQMKSFACQRRTPLKHHNAFLTEALEILAQNAEFTENEGRSVAFRRSAAVLKALPHAVRGMDELKGLPCLGEHSLRVIKEILEDGTSREVETTRQSEQFKAMKALTGVFGVGVKTADRWFREGLQSTSDLVRTEQKLNQAQRAGLQYYDDLNRPVTKAEAESISRLVEKAVNAVHPGSIVTLTGGFRSPSHTGTLALYQFDNGIERYAKFMYRHRELEKADRGKEVGHDVDFLITHPEEGTEEGLMAKIVNWLESQGLLLYQKTTRNSYLESKDGPARPASNMDRFERCFSIFKLERSQGWTDGSDGAREHSGPSWRAVRVDLVVSPYSQFAFATLGWTGSKLFERELRRWAGQEKAMSLSSHALYDSKRQRYLRAENEEEIFAHLGLEYIVPSERNA